MLLQRAFAVLLIALGIFLVVISPRISGGNKLIAIGPESVSHVTALTAGVEQSVLAGNQAGEVWRYGQAQWTKALDLDGEVITALAGEPERLPIGTGDGLWWPGEEIPSGASRVLDILDTGDALLAATPEGIWAFDDEEWHHLMPALHGYRLQEQRRGGQRHLHLGTIGDGVYSTATAQRLEPWQPNNRNLPESLKVLSFAVTDGGLLLAGTDRGLFWQVGPGHRWKTLEDAGLGKRRILALHCAPAGEDGLQRLWVGTDQGLMTLQLAESPGTLVSPELAHRIHAAPGQPVPEVPVSAIVPLGEGLAISAGTVYEVKEIRAPLWYLAAIAGGALAIIGGWMAIKPIGTAIRVKSRHAGR